MTRNIPAQSFPSITIFSALPSPLSHSSGPLDSPSIEHAQHWTIGHALCWSRLAGHAEYWACPLTSARSVYVRSGHLTTAFVRFFAYSLSCYRWPRIEHHFSCRSNLCICVPCTLRVQGNPSRHWRFQLRLSSGTKRLAPLAVPDLT